LEVRVSAVRDAGTSGADPATGGQTAAGKGRSGFLSMKNWAGISAVLAAITLGVGWASLRTDDKTGPTGAGGGSTSTQCSITVGGGTNTDAVNENHVCDTSTPTVSVSPVAPSREPTTPPTDSVESTEAAQPDVPVDAQIPTRSVGQRTPTPATPSPTGRPTATLSYSGGELEIALIGGGASKVATQSEADLQLYPNELAPLGTLAARANADKSCPTLTGENTGGIVFAVQDQPLFCVRSRTGDHYRIRIEPDNTSTTRPYPYTITVVMVGAA
jgi:hypothetical protein